MAKGNKGNRSGPAGKYKPEYCEEIIAHMEKGFSLQAFAGLLGVSRVTVDAWSAKYPEFKEAKDIATEKGRYFYERVGLDNLTLDKEAPFNTTLWIFTMKNRFGWRDKTETKIDAKFIDGAEGDAARSKISEYIANRGRK